MDQRAREFIEKAEKWLRWADVALIELKEYGEAIDLDAVERIFVGLLSNITIIHDSLVAAANCSDQNEWSQALDRQRSQDQLLIYVWKARDTETHDALVKWSPTMSRLAMQIVDRQAAFQTAGMFYQDQSRDAILTRLTKYIYEVSDMPDLAVRMQNRFRPSEERLRQAGVEIRFSHSLLLEDFWCRDKKGKRLRVNRPTKHLGRKLEPSAHAAAKCAVIFYVAKFKELAAVLGHPASLDLQSLQVGRL